MSREHHSSSAETQFLVVRQGLEVWFPFQTKHYNFPQQTKHYNFPQPAA